MQVIRERGIAARVPTRRPASVTDEARLRAADTSKGPRAAWLAVRVLGRCRSWPSVGATGLWGGRDCAAQSRRLPLGRPTLVWAPHADC
jgi:hypothetical protein